MHVRNTLFHHVCVFTDRFLVCAPELPCYWFYVISLPWTKRHIIHINKKGMMFKSNKLRSTTFCLCFDKVNLPWFILEENGSLFWQISRWMPFTQNLAYFSFCTLTLPMQYGFFCDHSAQLCSFLYRLFPILLLVNPFLFFAFPVLSNFILSHHIIGAEVLQCRPFLWNLKKKQWWNGQWVWESLSNE